MKKLVFFGLLAMFAINAVAQDDDNLVTNPSFESTGKGKLKKLKQITVAENWESPTGLNADLFDKSRAFILLEKENIITEVIIRKKYEIKKPFSLNKNPFSKIIKVVGIGVKK